MLKTRLISAGVLIFIVVYVLTLAPNYWFYPLYALLTFIVMLLASTEFIALRWGMLNAQKNIELSKPSLKFKHFCIGFAYAFPMVIYAVCHKSPKLSYLYQKTNLILLGWIFFAILLTVMCIYKNAENLQIASHKLINFMAGFIYLSVPAVLILKLLEFPEIVRASYVYFVLAVIHMGDAGGYFIGIKFGKHKLIPNVSPKKSVEGACGGLLFSALTAVFLKFLFTLPFSVVFSIMLGVILGLAGQLGDLIESAFKRASGFKDSSHLLPGHGGVLDRIDSLTLGIPVAFILLSFVL